MRLRRTHYLLITILISIFISSSLYASDIKQPRLKTKKQMIEYLNFKLDSLQKAYDSLLTDYKSLIEPISTTEEEIEEEEDDEALFPTENTPENIDSLLNIYYLQKSMTDFDIDWEIIEKDSLTSSIPDSVYIARLQKINSFIPLPFNKYVKNSIIRYTDKIPSITQNIISLSTYYLPQFEEIFDQYDLPKELKAMAIIESALNPKAVSRARAKGMWQFMYTTAKRYGLQMTSFVDERFDPITSCQAAAAYLKDAYMIFGDWSLAIASYNCGAGNVSKAIRRSGGKTDFWEIYNYLPRETRGYIPAFVAALYVLQYYPEHNITPKAVSLPAHVDTFHVNKMLHFQQISDNIGIPMESLREVNPQYIHDIIPGTEKTYILRIPHNYSMQFVDKEDQIYTYKDSVFFNTVTINKIKETGGSDGQRIIHKVRRGETLGHIAMKYHTSVANIKRWNGLRGNTIRVGQRLSIYGREASGSSKKASTSNSTQSSSTTDSEVKSNSDSSSSSSSTANYTMYTVKKNDTLWGIASQFTGVSLNDILELNGLTKKSKIYPGMKIRIKKAE